MLPQKFFARPLFPFGLRPTGKSGRSHMYLNPDKKNLKFLRMFQTETLPEKESCPSAEVLAHEGQESNLRNCVGRIPLPALTRRSTTC